jgi:cytoskeletal protein RodZ
MDSAAATQAIPRDGGADPTAMLGTVPADRADRYAEPEEEERRTSVGWIVVSLLALVVVGLAAFFITRAVTGDGTGTDTTLAPSTVPPTTAAPTSAPTTQPPTTAPPTTEPPTTAPPTTEPPTTAPPTTEPPSTAPATSEPPTT